MSRVRNYLQLLIVAWLATGCALYGGTEAGNPNQTGNAVPVNEPQSGHFAQYLLDKVCVKYRECYPSVGDTSCREGLHEQTNLPQAFGLAAGFGKAREMVRAEREGTIHGDYTAAVNCASQILQLSCSSSAISNSAPTGSTTNTNSYSGVINMIPTSGTSCAGVY